MGSIIFRDARIFDGTSPDLLDGDVLVADERIQEVSERPLAASGEVEVVECGGRTLMPGLIDAHVHVYASSVNLGRVARQPLSYLASWAARFLREALDRGFTSIRDVGGADVGLALALGEGLLTGPRLYYGGRVLSQTGGHGDLRPGDHELDDHHLCGCAAHSDSFATVADGPDAVRRAVREELRRGASHIKIMGSGGVSSPTDPLDRCQYSDKEILAAVDEAKRMGKYVAAHCHPAEAIRRCAELGVRSIEHGTLIDSETADFVAGEGVYIVPTMAIIFGLLEEGESLGFPAVSMAKLHMIGGRALEGLDVMHRAGVKLGFGTDLLGALQGRQSSEFTLRARVLKPIEILRSTCSINAELLMQSGQLGVIRPGAIADLLVVNGNPVDDIGLLARPAENLPIIMKGGRFHKRSC